MEEKCPICEGTNIYGNHLNSYDEPPEYLKKCSDCGFREFYFYYDGYVTSIDPPMFHNSLAGSKVFSVCMSSRKDFPSRKKFKEKLDKVLKKENLTVQDLIRNISNSKALKFNEEEDKKAKVKLTEERWAKGQLSDEEKIKLDEYLKSTLKLFELYQSKGIIQDLEKVLDGEYLVDLKYKYNQEEALSYIAEKEKAQNNYAITNGLPIFAPSNCWSCGVSVYDVYETEVSMFGKRIKTIKENVSMERASTQLITGCPNCNRSYVD